jgi:hypothetical protein
MPLSVLIIVLGIAYGIVVLALHRPPEIESPILPPMPIVSPPPVPQDDPDSEDDMLGSQPRPAPPVRRTSKPTSREISIPRTPKRLQELYFMSDDEEDRSSNDSNDDPAATLFVSGDE